MDGTRPAEAPTDARSLGLDEPAPGPLRELWLFVRATGKWWLVPVLVVLLLLGALAVLSTTAYAPFIDTLF